MITISALGTRWLYSKYYPNQRDWVAYYDQKVFELITSIRATRTGAALIDGIKKPIVIMPLDEDPLDVNAFASTHSCRNATQLGEVASCSTKKTRVIGTGSGASSTIRFTPGTWTRGDKLQQREFSTDAPGARPEEVLVHELVHAMRHTVGEWDRTSLHDGFDRVDEFQAIMVCNIFCSERTRPLRRNHSSHEAMQREFAADPFRFYAWYNRHISKFVSDHPTLSSQLNRVRCPWNPIREHFDYQQVLSDIAVDRATPKPGYY